jgi:YD repeat-containing protein
VRSTTVYDDNGRVCRTIENATTDPSTLDHPCSDPLAGATNLANVDTQTSYDTAGQKVKLSEPSPSDGATPEHRVITMYAYDDASRLCRVIENADADLDLSPLTDPCTDSLPSGHVTTTSTNLDTQYGYDADGNLASQYSAGVPAAGDLAVISRDVVDSVER